MQHHRHNRDHRAWRGHDTKHRALVFGHTWADASDDNSHAKPFWLAVQKHESGQGVVDLFRPGITHLIGARRKFKEKAMHEAHAQFSSSSLANLYDPLTLPLALLKAHQ